MNRTNVEPNVPTIAEIEALEQSRRGVLIAVVVASVAWLGPQAIQGAFADSLPTLLNNALIIVGVLGSLAFMAFMFRYHRFERKILANPQLHSHLDDERVVEVRKEAVYRGWITLAIVIAAGVAAAPFTELPDQSVLLTLLLVAVNAPILFFLALDKD